MNARGPYKYPSEIDVICRIFRAERPKATYPQDCRRIKGAEGAGGMRDTGLFAFAAQIRRKIAAVHLKILSARRSGYR
jgi:hypothetical protein